MIQVLFIYPLPVHGPDEQLMERNKRINDQVEARARHIATLAATIQCPNGHPPKAYTIAVWPTPDARSNWRHRSVAVMISSTRSIE
jgi:hypothetical protein